MKNYTNFGEGCNMPVTELVDEVVEHRARYLSRTIGIAYHVALASVRANIQIKEARHG
jgi:hypothetical protein